jgi:SAM-dependent methyltransferase
MDADGAALRAYYARGLERDRLSSARGQLEFARTCEIVLRALPPAPALVADAAGVPAIRTAVGDARKIDLPDASADAVLLCGPLYHLPDPAERSRALRESARILKPGGVLFAAAISRWAARLDGILTERIHQVYPELTIRRG